VKGELLPDGSGVFVTEHPKETEELGARLGRRLHSGALLFLWGDLGSGKTLFTQGITVGLQAEDQATSPTFALVHKYEGPIPIYHLDLYRLNSPAEVQALALEEMEAEAAVIIVEWGEYAQNILSPHRLEVFFQRGAGDFERTLILKPQGEEYIDLIKELVNDAGFRD
jgi:tRNA threonylcarbamoyladenosine biosynthesis protein TsaE